MRHTELEPIIAQLRALKVEAKYGDETETKCMAALFQAIAGILEDVADEGMYTNNMSRFAKNLIDAEEDFNHGVLEDMIKVRVLSPDQANDAIYSGDKHILKQDLNEIKHASIPYQKSLSAGFVWIDRWVWDAMQIYRKDGGYANLALRTFLRKMKPADEAVQSADYRAPGEKTEYKKKYGARHLHNGKNEYRPRTRDRKY